LVDAFRDGSVPVHLKTREFYELLKNHLTPGGVVALNIHSGTRLYDSDLATLRDVFSQVHLFPVEGTGNVVVLAFEGASPNWQDLNLASSHSASAYVKPHLTQAHVEYDGPAAPHGATVLTDDYAPAEFLESR
jgi:spermidine synthase